MKIITLINNISTFVKISDEIIVFENEMCVDTSRKAAWVKEPATYTFTFSMTSSLHRHFEY